MKTSFALSVLSLFYTHCLAASVDMWSSPLKERAALKYEAIEPEVVKARIGTTPEENSEGDRESGTVYFCREENWGAPCFAYRPELEYTCNELGSELKGHIGSVFVDPDSYVRILLTKQDSTMIDVPRSKYLLGPRPSMVGLTYSIKMPQGGLSSSELQQHTSHALSVPSALGNLDKTDDMGD
ncbi:uncharacterized protein FFUJ_04439 [Fusarium fujikuroi IMI 58289]|uniref:Uncharacterized protein n=1 Tax=Gibberella fujikuroi (strain CBS 195.34 / IMI 58289 / NRRL A-6831) TaxID=1279085 RepID=S0DPH8_GIBF5|nr:uncharacterized protein FFUJ_04439 [Fusarium fujikuroi IMI 58289]CCT64346.1 uncharacterized protein FFUJ_04439 [Fusarium fujikuroi IMI 58289]